MSTLWADFARTGTPAAPGVPRWPPYDGRTRETMLLNTNSHLVSDPDKPLRLAVDAALGFPV
jgi:para-nitrobenzyl esterase